MLKPRFFPYIFKNIVRKPARSLFTLMGVAAAMFLFFAVQAMHEGVQESTQSLAQDTRLVVYRKNRYCPFTSRMPESYARQIAEIQGVQGVIPMKIMVNNCRASLDVITFRGVPPNDFENGMMDDIKIIDGSLSNWKSRSDAALVGSRLAERRGLKVGDRINLGGVTVTISGVISSTQPQDQNVAYTHLDFLQRSSGNSIGVVTQFIVEVKDPDQLEAVSQAIDDMFRNGVEPTTTWNEKAFTARSASDLVEIVGFARMLGWGALVAVFALVANVIIISTHERVKEHAVLQTLGFSNSLIARLILAEGTMLSLFGGLSGLFLSIAVLRWGKFSFSTEGLSVNIDVGLPTIITGLIMCSLIGILAGLFPAWQASKRDIVSCFREV